MRFTSISLVTLLTGFIIGGLAQGSRMCFIGGWRDYFLIKDKYLLKGFFSFLITAVILFFLFNLTGKVLVDYPWFNRPPQSYLLTDTIGVYSENDFEVVEFEELRNLDECRLSMAPMAVVGEDIKIKGLQIFSVTIPNEIIAYLICAFIIGFFSTLANGCPLRQHVMAGSGNQSSVLYLLGFYAAILFYDSFLLDFVNGLLF